MTIAQGRALMPDLIVTHLSAAAELAATDALIDVAWSLSPVIEEHSPGCVWLDLTGMQRLHRHEFGEGAAELDFEQATAEEIARRVCQIGLEAAIGIASSKEIAHLAAQCGGLRPIAAGREREFLDWMPFELTGLASSDLIDRLKRMGLRRLGDLARLDSRAIGSRLGEAGVALARLGRGEGSAVVVARSRAEIFREAVEFEYGIETLEPLTFILRSIVDRLCTRLRVRGLAAGDLTLSLGLADRRRDDRRVAVAAPTIEPQVLLTLLRLSLEAKPPAASIETIQLTTEPRRLRPMLNDLFLPPAPATDRLAVTVARIASLCGPDYVGTLLPAASYRPEAVRVGVFAPSPAGHQVSTRQTETHGTIAPIALRVVRPAEEVEVLCERETPAFVRGRKISARVISSAGPWRRQGEWWAIDAGDPPSWQANRPSAYARDYYELALADGAVYRVYYDHHLQIWFVDGVYD
jgi:protein ImuB